MESKFPLFEHTVGRAKVEPYGNADIYTPSMVFSVKSLPTNGDLHLVASDFHDGTWTSTLTTIDLNNMQKSIGIIGDFRYFLQWLHRAFSSELVSFKLNSSRHTVQTGLLLCQPAKGEPRVKVPLQKVTSHDVACDQMLGLAERLLSRCKEQQLDVEQGKKCIMQLEEHVKEASRRAESKAGLSNGTSRGRMSTLTMSYSTSSQQEPVYENTQPAVMNLLTSETPAGGATQPISQPPSRAEFKEEIPFEMAPKTKAKAAVSFKRVRPRGKGTTIEGADG